jgi:hypothetical protein
VGPPPLPCKVLGIRAGGRARRPARNHPQRAAHPKVHGDLSHIRNRPLSVGHACPGDLLSCWLASLAIARGSRESVHVHSPAVGADHPPGDARADLRVRAALMPAAPKRWGFMRTGFMRTGRASWPRARSLWVVPDDSGRLRDPCLRPPQEREYHRGPALFVAAACSCRSHTLLSMSVGRRVTRVGTG